MTETTCTHAPLAVLWDELMDFHLGCAANPMGFAEPDGCNNEISHYVCLIDANWDGEGTHGFVVAPVCPTHLGKVSMYLAPRAAEHTMAERVPERDFPKLLASFHADKGLCTRLGMHFLAGARTEDPTLPTLVSGDAEAPQG